jgi:hypothetical protein
VLPKLAYVKKKGQIMFAVNVSITPALHLSGQKVKPPIPAAVAAFKVVIQLAGRALLTVSNDGTQFPNAF